MSTPASSSAAGVADGVTVLARWCLGGVFVYMGLVKALHPVDFLKLVRQYDVLGEPPWLNAVAMLLPWLEVFCGLLMLLGLAVRGTAVTLATMLVTLTLLVLRRALALSQANGLPFCAIKFDCGCGAGEVFICPKLVENILLVSLSIWLCFRGGDRLCWRSRLL